MRKFVKPTVNSIIPGAFSILKIKSGSPINVNAAELGSLQNSYMPKDAERVFSQFLK